MKSLPTGKLPAHVLAKLLARYPCDDDTVIVGPRPGEDAAVIDLGDCYLVAATDPITFATEDIGWYAVNVNANDVACCGATPRWFLATLLLPKGTTEASAEHIFAQIHAAAAELDVSVVGGHSEITHGLDRPLVIGQMLGTAQPHQLVTTGGAKSGDDLVLSKAIALEGIAIVATEKRAALQTVLSAVELDQAAGLLKTPGISVVRDAMVAGGVGGVNAMHDPTEGGLATGLKELADASGNGLVVNEAAIPKVAFCERICHHLDLEPLGLLASGSLLMSVSPDKTQTVIDALVATGIEATVIGRVIDKKLGCRLERHDGRVEPLPVYPRDEITKIFD